MVCITGVIAKKHGKSKSLLGCGNTSTMADVGGVRMEKIVQMNDGKAILLKYVSKSFPDVYS